MTLRKLLVLAMIAGAASSAASYGHAETSFTVRAAGIVDQKAVFATMESLNVVPARARIGGTIAALSIKDGDHVDQDQVVAVVGDEKLLLQIGSLDAQIAGLQSQLAQAQTDLTRAETLFRQGSGARVAMDQARTQADVATSALRARTAERAVVQQRLAEGEVLAPASGRVLNIPVTKGTVVLGGDTVAMIAEQNYVLRLRVPERHAAFLKAGDTVRLAGRPTEGGASPAFGRITLVYPRIEEGRVIADARVDGLGDYFVGERVGVWIGAGKRTGIVIPADFIHTRFGLDYVDLRAKGGGAIEVPVQRGQDLPTPDMPDGVEMLSGLHAGDVLVRP